MFDIYGGQETLPVIEKYNSNYNKRKETLKT